MAKASETFDPTINPLALDKEWLGQPNMAYFWAAKLAAARKRVEEAKNAFEVERAEVMRAIRSEPFEYGIDKVTEQTTEAAIIVQKEYQLAAQAVVDAKYEADMVAAAVTAIDHRRRSLENLVELHAMQYFSDPKVSSDDAKTVVRDTEARGGYKPRARQREE